MTVLNIEKLVNQTVNAARAVEQEASTLFNVVMHCVSCIKDDKDLKNYKKRIKKYDVCRSTIYIMINVAKCDVLAKHKDELPSSYQTLYECLKLLNDVELAQFEQLIVSKKLNKHTSKSDVVKLRKEHKTNNNELINLIKTKKITCSEIIEATETLVKKEKISIINSIMQTLTDKEREKLIKSYYNVI